MLAMTLSLIQDTGSTSIPPQPEPVLLITPSSQAGLQVPEPPLGGVAEPELVPIAAENPLPVEQPVGHTPEQAPGHTPTHRTDFISTPIAAPELPPVPEFYASQPSGVTRELASAFALANAITHQISLAETKQPHVSSQPSGFSGLELQTTALQSSWSSAASQQTTSLEIHQVEIRVRTVGGATESSEVPPPSPRLSEAVVQQELRVRAGQALAMDAIHQDLHHLHQLGLFSAVDASIVQTPQGAIVTYEVTERVASEFRIGGGTDQFIGVYGALGYRNQQLGGLGQQLDTNLQLSTTGDVQFLVSLSSPYRRSGDSVGYRVYLFRDRVQANRLGGGFALSRPVGDWQGTIALDYARITVRDRDTFGNPLSFSRNLDDDLLTLSLGMALDRRNHPIHPTQGWLLRLGTEQALPIGAGNVSTNRLRASFVQYVALQSAKPDPMAEILAIRLEGATALGELLPYWSFSPGDPSFVTFDRVRSYVLASVEYRLPLGSISLFGSTIPLGGVFFVDVGSDLGSGNSVIGRISNSSSGIGVGYGIGLRANSPWGLTRLDLGIGNQGDFRIQVGFGQRF